MIITHTIIYGIQQMQIMTNLMFSVLKNLKGKFEMILKFSLR